MKLVDVLTKLVIHLYSVTLQSMLIAQTRPYILGSGLYIHGLLTD